MSIEPARYEMKSRTSCARSARTSCGNVHRTVAAAAKPARTHSTSLTSSLKIIVAMLRATSLVLWKRVARVEFYLGVGLPACAPFPPPQIKLCIEDLHESGGDG